MATVPLTIRQRVQQQRRKVEKREVVVELNQHHAEEFREYNKALRSLVNEMAKDVKNNLFGILKSYQSEYISDGYAKDINTAIDSIAYRWVNITSLAQRIAYSFVSKVSESNKEDFNKAIRKSIGVDLPNILQSEGLTNVIEAKTIENVRLIKSIPEEYFKNIATIVNEGVTRGNRASSIISQILKLNNKNRNRAKLIARDQTSKVSSAVSQARQESLNIKKYRWRTSEDERVRDTHRRNNGKIFSWNKPPKDTGHPGQDIQCRCVAEPIIEL